jgi:hypothetical protein
MLNTISGLAGLHKEVAAIEQKYKFATRSYAGMIDRTALDITVNFSLNLNDSNQAYLYKTLDNGTEHNTIQKLVKWVLKRIM